MFNFNSAILLFTGVLFVAANEVEEPLPLGRQLVIVTSSVFSTATITGSTVMTTITTHQLCLVPATSAIIVEMGTSSTYSSPTGICRRKRGILQNDVFIGLPHDNLPVQFYRLTPSQVMRFEPSRLPYFAPDYPARDADVLVGSPAVLQPSFERQGPFLNGLFNFGLQFSSLVSNIVSNVLTNVISTSRTSSLTSSSSKSSSSTSTNSGTTTVTVFTTSVVTSTKTPTITYSSYSSTRFFFVAGSCYPSHVQICYSPYYKK